MPDHTKLETPTVAEADDPDSLRVMNRSPHPYHHQSADLPHPSHRLNITSIARGSSFSKESTPASDSGTEADDEHILKGLPAPKSRLHKGLRGRNEVLSGASTPLLSQSMLEEDSVRLSVSPPTTSQANTVSRSLFDTARQYKNLVRRITEVALVALLGILVVTNKQVAPVANYWKTDFIRLGLLFASLIAVYPLRLMRWAYWNTSTSTWLPIRLPANFDPAPVLYPPSITLLVSLLVSPANRGVILPNIILSISSLPQQFVPKFQVTAHYDVAHWVLACLPLAWAVSLRDESEVGNQLGSLNIEAAVLLYPLHKTVCALLHYLTTTSLLDAELQLLSVVLVDVLVLSVSPQLQILKALLWGGGIGILVFCSPVIHWGITLARVPRWRFRRVSGTTQSLPLWKRVYKALSSTKRGHDAGTSQLEELLFETPDSEPSDDGSASIKQPARSTTTMENGSNGNSNDPTNTGVKEGLVSRRHTLPTPEKPTRKPSPGLTSSGRKKRGTSISARPFLKLTQEEAVIRKWAYALYVYSCIILIILVGIRAYVQKFALNGNEPIGWAVGYLFGDLPWLRFQVISANLERWICLPPLRDPDQAKTCLTGWVEHVRVDDIGAANMRLFLSGYWLLILTFGLLVVFQLKDTYEVDTRRKVFHFMMVGMLLPATFVDPTYVALALALILAIFLILDLLRASQLPPLSKPLAAFLAPYVDGRDFRGPVVISHIFLLIGCAIPIWLALGALPRTGSGYLAGWEVPTRDVSMVSGVVCVGLGDAAASLIGRRYGHRKWLWGGGKSLEGSVAFACAVFLGLTAVTTWLRVGGWPISEEPAGLVSAAINTGICSSIASVTEAVLTGGNDNVIVPVVLWTCVKSLRI